MAENGIKISFTVYTHIICNTHSEWKRGEFFPAFDKILMHENHPSVKWGGNMLRCDFVVEKGFFGSESIFEN